MPADKRQERKSRFKLDLLIGNREYFLRQASSGLVGGPKSRDGVHRHITVAVDPETELVRHVHMKSGRGSNLREDWRLHPERIMSDVNSWIRRNSVSLAASEIPRIDGSSYIVSARRILVTFHILQSLGSKIIWLLVRGFRFIPFQIVKGDREIRVAFVVDPHQLEKRLRRFGPLLTAVNVILPKVIPRLLKRVAKLQLVRMKDMADGDVCVIFSRLGAEPTVVVKQKEFFSIKLEKVVQTAMDLYSRFKIAELKPDFDASKKPARIEMIVRDSE